MPDLLENVMQLVCSAGARHRRCRRASCRRNGYCTPPQDDAWPVLYRCRFDDYDEWGQRVLMVEKVAERLMALGNAANKKRGLPPLSLEPVPYDHLDLTKPLDYAALRASPLEASPAAPAPASRRRRAP